MKSPAEIVIDLMNESPAETETRRMLAKSQRESFDEYQEECEPSERQQGHIDAGMKEGDFY